MAGSKSVAGYPSPVVLREVWMKRGMRGYSGVMKMLYILIVIVVIKLHTLVKIHRAVQQKMGRFYGMLIIP